MHTVQNTLYVVTPNAYAHLENNTVRIDVEREKRLQVPLHHLGRIVCFGNVLVSPGLMHRLADEGKKSRAARRLGPVQGPAGGSHLRKHSAAAGPAPCIVRPRLHAGVRPQRRGRQAEEQPVGRAAREADDAGEALVLSRAADDLAASLRAAATAPDLDTLRGVEGETARGYFIAINLVVKPGETPFRPERPHPQAASGPLHALISFLYAMLMNDCRSAVESVGLDPQLGYLHAVRPGRAALALDLREEFRSVLADRLALTLINRGQVTADDFDNREGGAVLLNETGRRKVVTARQEGKQEEITHPLLDSKLPLALLPFIQARFMAPTLRGEMDGY
jgi:CRISP-associated protein Cas1